MNFARWIERIYSENDIGRGIATTISGITGLASYLYWSDWVIACFVTIIVFPVSRIVVSTIHSRLIESRKSGHSKDIKDLFEKLSHEEKQVVQAFVWHGGCAMTWRECDKSPSISFAGIESLRNRDLIHTTVTADGMQETFVLNIELFDYAQTVPSNVPF